MYVTLGMYRKVEGKGRNDSLGAQLQVSLGLILTAAEAREAEWASATGQVRYLPRYLATWQVPRYLLKVSNI